MTRKKSLLRLLTSNWTEICAAYQKQKDKILPNDRKRCTYCGAVKDLDEFYHKTNGKIDSQCKPCRKSNILKYQHSKRNSNECND